jgi:hypothetical protein
MNEEFLSSSCRTTDRNWLGKHSTNGPTPAASIYDSSRQGNPSRTPLSTASSVDCETSASISTGFSNWPRYDEPRNLATRLQSDPPAYWTGKSDTY